MHDFELNELERKYKDPLIKNLIDYQRSLQTDPAKKLHVQVRDALEIIGEDLDKIKNIGAPLGEDPTEKDMENQNFKVLGSKIFDNLITLIKSLPAIQDSMRKSAIESEIMEGKEEGTKILSTKKRPAGVALS